MRTLVNTLKYAAVTALAVSSLSALAANGTLQVTAPTANGTAGIFVTDLTGGTITANVNINGNWTATQKRDAIFNAINAQAAANGWGIAKNGAAGITINNGPKDPLVINFNPRGTGETRDVIVGSRGASFQGGHGTMDPHAPSGSGGMMSLMDANGAAATFTAGVDINGTDYTTTLTGDNPLFNGVTVNGTLMTSSANIGAALYNQLLNIAPVGATFSLGTNGVIGVDFAPGSSDISLIWGTSSNIVPTSSTLTDDSAGFQASLTISAVPEPSQWALASVGMLLLWNSARKGRKA